MECRKLYYEDPHMERFTARVTGCSQADKGWEVTLDATAFYPEGGGQASDVGKLGQVQVLHVKEVGDQVVHLCDGPVPVGSEVAGKICWERRFDLMQQHSGEHIVSGIIHQRYGYHNVGFHMGADMVTIDFDGPIPAEDLALIEKQANEAIWQNIPVKCWYPAREELPQVKYRSKKELPWPVRVVQIPEYDTCACCGTHVAATGEIGIIKLFTCVKFHQGVRIEMACGGRALDYLSRVYEQNRLVSQAFSAKVLETGAAAQRMNDQLAAEKFRAAGLEKQIFDSIAASYAGKGSVCCFREGLEPGGVRELADRIAQSCGATAVVFSGKDAEGYSLCIVNHSEDIAPLGKAAAAALEGRGGGKKGYFQGSIKATQAQIEAFFAEHL